MEARQFRFGFDELGLTVRGIEEVMGYNDDDEREFIASMIQDILQDCSMIADVRAEYRIFGKAAFESIGRKMIIDDTAFNIEKIVYSQIKKSDFAAFFLCTAGSEPGRKSRKFMNERDLLTGYIYDVIGSEIVEAAADRMQDYLGEAAASEGLKITNRYSPGYCGWNVSEQHKLFSFFKDNYCGIRLLPSALMDPEKSVSGVIGIGENVKKNPYTCRMCDMKDCIYRRLREEKSNR